MVNKVSLIGNVGKAPEIYQFDNGDKVASFSLATTESYKNKDGEKVSNTEWHNIKCFKYLADLAEKWITKGKQLYVEGKISYRKYEKDGVTRYATEITAYSIQFLGNKSQDEKPVEKPAPKVESHDEPEDLPF